MSELSSSNDAQHPGALRVSPAHAWEIFQRLCFVCFPSLWLSAEPSIHVDRKAGILWCWALVCLIEMVCSPALRRRLASQSWVFWGFFCALVGVAGLSTILAMDPVHSLFAGPTFRMGLCTVVACWCVALRFRHLLREMLPWLYLQASLLALSSLWLDLSTWPEGFRLRGGTYQPNILAAHLAMGFLLGWMLRARAKQASLGPGGWWRVGRSEPVAVVDVEHGWSDGAWRVAWWSGQGVLLGGLWLTQSRGALVLLGGCLFVRWVWRAVHRRQRRQRQDGSPEEQREVSRAVHRWWRGAVIVCVLVLLGVGAWQHPAFKRFRPSSRWLAAGSYRLQLQQHGVLLLGDVPWHGWGFDSIIFAFGALHPLPPALQKSVQRGVSFDSTHNWHLDKFLELGWFGGSLFLCWLCWALIRGWRTRETWWRWIGWGLLVFLCLRYLWSVSMMEIEFVYWWLIFALVGRDLPDQDASGITGARQISF